MNGIRVVPSGEPVPAHDERGLPPGYRFRRDWEVTPREVEAMLSGGGLGGTGDSPGGILLDCRTEAEHAVSRIAGSLLIPMHEIEQRLDELESEDRDGKARPIVVYCHHGVRSIRVAAVLRAAGFSDVKSMAGGIEAWSCAVDSGVPRYEK